MPLYEYTCHKCHQKFELLRSFSQASERSPVCEYCGSPDTARNLGSLLAVFGSGAERGIERGSSCGSCSSSGSSACSSCGGGR